MPRTSDRILLKKGGEPTKLPGPKQPEALERVTETTANKA